MRDPDRDPFLRDGSAGEVAVWFEITHPEEDYWHRSAMRRDGPEKVSWLKPAGDLEDVQYQSCSQEEVNGQKEEA